MKQSHDLHDHAVSSAKQCLITGGSGFLGQALVMKLLDMDWHVTVVTRNPQETTALFQKLLVDQPLLSNLNIVSTIPPATEWHYHAVINLAGANLFDSRWTATYKQTLLDSRLQTTQALVACIASLPVKQRPQQLISGSAIGYYGAQPPEKEVTEDTPPADDFAATLCKDWEAAAKDASQYGVAVDILRTGIVMHPAGGALAKQLLPFKLGLGGRLGSGKQMLSWVSRQDWVDMVVWLLQREWASPAVSQVIAKTATRATQAWNVTSPNPVSNRLFTNTLSKVLSRPTFFRMPSFLLKILLGEAASLLLTGQQVVPRHAQQEGYNFTDPELEPVLRKMLN